MIVPADRCVERLRDWVQLHDFLSLASRGWINRADVFQTEEWLQLLGKHGFVDSIEPLFLGVRLRSGTPAFVLPLAVDAGELRSLSNYYSSLFGPVGEPTVSVDWEAVVRYLMRHPNGGVIDLKPLAEDGAWVDALARALRARGYWVDRYFCFGNWYQPIVHARFADYLSARPSALRHSIERGRRRLQRAGGYALAIHRSPGRELDDAIAAFASVYRRSWKQAEPAADFMPLLLRMAAEHGWLRLGVLHIQGEPIAAQVWLVKSGKANIYKLAYVQGFERFSPGSVLTAALMEHAMDTDGVREVDYLTGDDAYKRDWMSHRRERIGLVAFHPLRGKGLLGAARHFGGKGWRWLRRTWKNDGALPGSPQRSVKTAQP